MPLEPDSATTQCPRSLPYMPQLDALRAAAVTVVVLWHFTSRRTVERALFVDFGVRAFFVLSGFLITALLLIARADCQAGEITTRAAATRFYGRRALRIVPIYYGTLLFAAALRVSAVTDAFWWHFAYLSNVKFALSSLEGPASHFWTLAVEEQFYLVWPWVVLVTSTTTLRRIAIGGLVFAPLFRLWADWMHVPRFGMLLPFGSLDALGAGAVLATWWYEGRLNRVPSRGAGWFVVAAVIGGVMVLTGAFARPPFAAIFGTYEALVLMPIVGYAALGVRGLTGRVLESRPVRYVGKTSYGIYVYHNFMPDLLHGFASRVNVAVPTTGARAVVLAIAATLVVASASWRFIERPLQRLRHRTSTETFARQSRRSRLRSFQTTSLY